jgi:predicted nucleotidyltransferase
MQTVTEKRKEILEKELKRIVGAIIKGYSPEKIILFGSLAGGHVHEWSDIDLVIVKETKERLIERLHKVHLMAAPNIGVNFIVYTPREVKRMIEQNHYFFTDEILKKGRVLYERDK